MNPQARSSKSKERLERFENLSSELKDLKDVLKTTNEGEISSIKSRIGKILLIFAALNR